MHSTGNAGAADGRKPTVSYSQAGPAPVVEWYAGALQIWHQLSEHTDGQLSMAEVTLRRDGEPPMHVHAREDELFFVLDGEVTFQRGLSRVQAIPGSSVWLPRGVAHGFAVRTDTARMLHLYTPGGIEQAHRAFAEPAPDRVLPPAGPGGAPDPEAMATVAAEFERHGVTFVGPPLSVILAADDDAPNADSTA